MSNLEKYKNCFVEAFEVDIEDVDSLEYQSIDEWDSVGHMSLMSEPEDTFDITLEMNDIIDFSSFKKGIETLTKYGVDLNA